MNKILKFIVYFSLILFSGVFMIKGASARTLDHVPPIETLPGYTDKYVIVYFPGDNFYRVKFEQSNVNQVKALYIGNDGHLYMYYTSGYSTIYYYAANWSDSWILETSGYNKTLDTTFDDKYLTEYPDGNHYNSNGHVVKTTVDIVNTNDNSIVYFNAGYDEFEDETGIRFDIIWNDNNTANVTVDYSDYLVDGINTNNYKFVYEDETTDDGFYNVTNDLILGKYTRNVKYKIKMTAKVLDQNNNVVAENTLNLKSNGNNLLSIYRLEFPLNRNISLLKDYPQDKEPKIVKHITTDMTDDDYRDFFELWEGDFFWGHEYVSIGFFTDEQHTNRIFLDNTWTAARDLTIYSEWSSDAPAFEPYLKYDEDSDTVRLYFNFTHWNNSDYRIAYRNGATNFTYTDQTSPDVYQIVDKFDIIELEYFVIENSSPHTLAKYYVHVGQVLSADEKVLEEITTAENKKNETYMFGLLKNIFGVVKPTFEAIAEIIAYAWGKCNAKIKMFIIFKYTTIFVVGIFKGIGEGMGGAN